nr:MAG TPA: hypothetical protein [Caudoviricetes sp.]
MSSYKISDRKKDTIPIMFIDIESFRITKSY